MLDVKITGYVVPVAEQPQASLTPVISVENVADEAAVITGLIRIYRESTGLMIYSSELAVTQLEHHSTTNIAALTPFDPPAPADDDYFVKADIIATSFLPGPPITNSLGAWHFDIKTPPMGEAPAGHAVTHELGGSDPVNVGGLVGNPDPHHGSHELAGGDQISVAGLSGELADPQPPKAHDIAGAAHTSGATPGQVLQADANGLPVDATNTDTDVADAVSKRDCRANGEASSAAPTPNADTTDFYFLSALAEGATFGAPTGSPVEGQKLVIRILDDGTARALAWDAGAGGYIARGISLPVTTVISKYLYVGLIYNATADLWDCVARSQEA